MRPTTAQCARRVIRIRFSNGSDNLEHARIEHFEHCFDLLWIVEKSAANHILTPIGFYFESASVEQLFTLILESKKKKQQPKIRR